jgi:hypothetical protein
MAAPFLAGHLVGLHLQTTKPERSRRPVKFAKDSIRHPRSIPAAKTARFPMQFGDKYLTKFHGLLVVTILDLQLWSCLNEVTL